MSHGQFEASNHVGSIIIIAITVLVCLLCLIFQLCKKFTRLDDTETIQTPVDAPTLPSNEETPNLHQFINNQNSIGWNALETNPKEQFISNYFPIGFNPPVDSKNTTPTYEESNLKGQRSSSSSSRSNVALKTPTDEKLVRSSPSYGRQERIHPGFKDHVLYGGEKRNIPMWSNDDRKY